MRPIRILFSAIGASVAIVALACGGGATDEHTGSATSAVVAMAAGAGGWTFTRISGVTGELAIGAGNGPLVDGAPQNGIWLTGAETSALTAANAEVTISPPLVANVLAMGGGPNGHAWGIDDNGLVWEWNGSGWTEHAMPSGIAAKTSSKVVNTFQSTIAVDSANNAYVVSTEQQGFEGIATLPDGGVTGQLYPTGNYTIWKYTSGAGTWARMAVAPQYPMLESPNFIGIVGTQVAIDPTQSSTVWTLATSTDITVGMGTSSGTSPSGPVAWNATATTWSYPCTASSGCRIDQGGQLYDICSTYLAVGPGNVPWILDCTYGNGGNRMEMLPPSASAFMPVTTSSGGNVYGSLLAVDSATGVPWYMDWNGNVYQGGWPSGCTPLNAATLCGSSNCGYVSLGCGQSATCGPGSCPAQQICTTTSGSTAGTCTSCPAGTFDLEGTCTGCGGINQWACPAGANNGCSAGLVSLPNWDATLDIELNTCVPCGANGQNPCSTSANSGCNTGTILAGSGLCQTCGNQDIGPCANDTCPGISGSSIVSNGECEPCPSNEVANSSRSACVTCPAGQGASNGACVACTGDTASSNGVCTACPSNEVPSAGNGSCTSCPIGEGASNGACVACTGDTASSNGVCTACPSNEVPSAGNGSCTSCPSGQGASNGSCVACSGDTYSNGGVCANCPTNYLSNASHTACQTCPSGYGDENGLCTACSGNTYSSGGACVSCPSKEVANSSHSGCNVCPAGEGYSNGQCVLCTGSTASENGVCSSSCGSNGEVPCFDGCNFPGWIVLPANGKCECPSNTIYGGTKLGCEPINGGGGGGGGGGGTPSQDSPTQDSEDPAQDSSQDQARPRDATSSHLPRVVNKVLRSLSQ